MKSKTNTKFLVTTSVCVGIAVLLRSFALMITAGGVLTMRISFGAIFYVLPGLLFGPLYGGLAGGVTDVITAFVRPMGAYIPIFTITNIIAGFLPALIWDKIKFSSAKKVKIYYIIFFTLIGIVGVFNSVMKTFYQDSQMGKLILSMGKKSAYLSVGFILIALVGFVLLIINKLILKKNLDGGYNYIYTNYLKIFISVCISGVIVSTLNTYFILIFTPALAAKGFIILWIPRIVETLIMSVINSYILTILLYSYSMFGGKVARKI